MGKKKKKKKTTQALPSLLTTLRGWAIRAAALFFALLALSPAFDVFTDLWALYDLYDVPGRGDTGGCPTGATDGLKPTAGLDPDKEPWFSFFFFFFFFFFLV